MEGWIKLHRKFSDWEWFNVSEMVHLFIFLLINANSQDGEWRGVNIKRGQILTGLNSLNKSTKISIQTLRTCLKRLEKTGEINTQVTNKYSIITICKYEDYQKEKSTTNKQSNKQTTFNQQATNNKQEGKEEEEINTNVFIYSKFYDEQIELSKNDPKYLFFVKFIFGENETNQKLSGVLSIRDQLSFDNFKRLLETSKLHQVKLMDTVLKMENDNKYTKGKKVLYTTLNNWITGRFAK